MPSRVLPLVVALSGPSGAGKTTLARTLCRLWSARGLRVGYVKHASHGFTLDRPGKDSLRLARAGARRVVVVGPEGYALLARETEPSSVPLVERHLHDLDRVVVEGFRDDPWPRVFVAPARGPLQDALPARARWAAALVPRSRVAAVRALLPTVPVFARGDEERLAALLERTLTPTPRAAGGRGPRGGRRRRG